MTKHTADPADLVTVSIPRSALTVVAPPPSHVDQHTVQAVVGLDRKTYEKLSRKGLWPVAREGRKLIAKTSDVQRYLDERAAPLVPRPRPRPLAKTSPADAQDAEFDELPLPPGVRHAS